MTKGKDDYRLVELIDSDDKILKIFYDWYDREDHFDHYTCRPFNKHDNYKLYKEAQIKTLKNKVKTFYLVNNKNQPLGKVSLFDYNSRNRSAEFGYYFPKEHRGKAYGRVLLNLFIEHVFNIETLNINKLYATTASSNIGSIKLLEKFNFKLDGVNREHYFIGDMKYDQHHYSILRKERG